jgi:hypothetical protein
MSKEQLRFEVFTKICMTNTEWERVKLFMEIEGLITETENAFEQLKTVIADYWKHEDEASKELKILMLMNNWHSPFETCTELVKRIETNEAFLKNMCKVHGETFRSIGYKAKSKDARELLNKVHLEK